MPPIALTIAGSDPSGGAGIQADLKTFHQFGVYGEAVITLLTVQNTVRVSRVVVMPPALVLEHLAAVLEDIPPAAAKTGALGSAEMVEAVARAATDFTFPLVVDPVVVSKEGVGLLSPAAPGAHPQTAAAARLPHHAERPRGRSAHRHGDPDVGRHAPRRLPPPGTGRARRAPQGRTPRGRCQDRKSTRLNSSH